MSEVETTVENILECSRHKSEQIRFWCDECEEHICNECFENYHDGHKLQSLKNFLKKRVPDYKNEVSNLSSDLEKMITKCQKHMDACKEFKESLTAEKEKVEKVSKEMEDVGNGDEMKEEEGYKFWKEKEDLIDSAKMSLNEARETISNEVRLCFRCLLFFKDGKWHGGVYIAHGKNIFRVQCKELTSFGQYIGDSDSPHAKEHCSCRDLTLEISWGDQYFDDKDFAMSGEIRMETRRRSQVIQFEGSCRNGRSISIEKEIPTHNDDGNYLDEIFPGQYGLDIGVELNFFVD